MGPTIIKVPLHRAKSKKCSLTETMVLPTRDLTVLLVVTVVALVSFHWEAAFEFRTLEPLPIQTTSAEGEFTNVYVALFRPQSSVMVF